MNEDNDEIIIGINVPKSEKGKKKYKKRKKEVAVKKATSKEKKQKVRIKNNTKIFRNRILKKIFLVLVGIIAIIFFLSSNFFSVKKIDVQNISVLTKEKIITLLNLDQNQNIFGISEKIIKQKLKKNAYIEDATVKKVLPNKLVIEIKERSVKYMIQIGEAFVYINNQGYILEKAGVKKEVPILIGVTTDVADLVVGKRLNNSDLKKIDAINKICESAENNGLMPLISKIDISNKRNYTLYLDSENKIVYLGDGSNINTRLLYVNAILEQEKGVEGEIFVNVDLNNQNVYFREKI